MKTFKELKVWNKAHGLVLDIYKVTKKFPVDEKFGLSAQIRRSVASVPTNIVEGFKRKSNKEWLHFLNIADASLEETKYHLILSSDLGYIDSGMLIDLTKRCEEIGRMITGLQKKLLTYTES